VFEQMTMNEHVAAANLAEEADGDAMIQESYEVAWGLPGEPEHGAERHVHHDIPTAEPE
jgi:hypothetical protein